MKWIACASLFVCVSTPASWAQVQRPSNRDGGDLPLRQLHANIDFGPGSSPSTPAPAHHPPVIPMSATVSVNDLKLPVAAKKELARFQQSLQSGNMEDCVKHLTKAIHIYSQIAAAHQNLAACYVRLNEYQKAVSEFQAASELDENMIQPALGLAGAYLVLGRYADAESASRRALEINPVDSMAHYLLGRALAFEGRDTAETEELLHASATQFPDARLALAAIFLRRNAREEALTELRAYVEQPGVPQKNKETIGCAIEELRELTQSLSCAAVSATPTVRN